MNPPVSSSLLLPSRIGWNLVKLPWYRISPRLCTRVLQHPKMLGYSESQRSGHCFLSYPCPWTRETRGKAVTSNVHGPSLNGRRNHFLVLSALLKFSLENTVIFMPRIESFLVTLLLLCGGGGWGGSCVPLHWAVPCRCGNGWRLDLSALGKE